ncbi:FAD/NAD-P-binding domain-containing protein [Trametes versicolor FP-101664 SS1]|uniref:FAD/NAD-P-binding domain-containing protein n=1 Tax=Trametes versicolor (strain FP-101664) TaxID=717944 RepID=UPI00046242CC|nr:FAD/NAD-P-binding domain-containing protein [Trametes versicolor FP-101664 SS1]EIW62323.1 FAD/NAD-P-binding domain-containing protein [Trametes versicolor FP-101664 SS1]
MDFDVLVLGTGLSESIAAAALSKAGFKVAHVDNNQYYGGDEASLTLDELAVWADSRTAEATEKSPTSYFANQRTRYTSVSRSPTIPPQSRQYSVPLAPSIVPSVGPHIDSLVASGVSRYGSFKLLEKVAVYDRPGVVQSVPGSKEDVFKSKALSLLEKRRLMRFLLFAAGEFEGKKELEGKERMPFLQFLREAFSLSDKPATAITYALAFCITADEPTLPALSRIRQYLRSAGRYGATPFLVGHYGGLGETAQGFCRTSAVKGGTYILGRRVVAVKSSPPTADAAQHDEKASTSSNTEIRYSVELEDFDEPLTAKILLASPDYVSPGPTVNLPSSSTPALSNSVYAVARCVAIVDKPLSFTPSEPLEEPAAAQAETEDAADDEAEETPSAPLPPNYEVDTVVLVFPPGSLVGGSSTTAAHVLVTGEGSMSAPRGKWIINISLPCASSAEQSRSAEELLRPYLDATLTLTAPPPTSSDPQPTTPLFTVFYIHHPAPHPPAPSTVGAGIIVSPPHTSLLPEIADAATQHAEVMFWKAVETLGRRPLVQESGSTDGVEDKSEESGEKEAEEDSDSGEIDSFWPPLDAAEVESADDW